MRHFTLAIAAATMIGLGAAHAEQPAVRGHQPGAREHHQPTAHRILADVQGSGVDLRTSHAQFADADGSGADVRANPNVHRSTVRRS